MSKIKRWLDKRRVVWAEPALPKYVKINPLSPPGAAEGIQPGDFSMLKVTEEFLAEDEEFGEAPEEGLALPDPRGAVAGYIAGHLPPPSTRHIVWR
jgi:hypothetical protein